MYNYSHPCNITLGTRNLTFLSIPPLPPPPPPHTHTHTHLPPVHRVLKASSHIVFDGIQRYCNTLPQPYGNTQIKFWIPANPGGGGGGGE